MNWSELLASGFTVDECTVIRDALVDHRKIVAIKEIRSAAYRVNNASPGAAVHPCTNLKGAKDCADSLNPHDPLVAVPSTFQVYGVWVHPASGVRPADQLLFGDFDDARKHRQMVADGYPLDVRVTVETYTLTVN